MKFFGGYEIEYIIGTCRACLKGNPEDWVSLHTNSAAIESNYINLGKEMFLLMLRTDLGQEYASQWYPVPLSNCKNVQAVWQRQGHLL